VQVRIDGGGSNFTIFAVIVTAFVVGKDHRKVGLAFMVVNDLSTNFLGHDQNTVLSKVTR
jgi:hypothetical protein